MHALAAGADGGLYVGTSPDGKIYQVAADGTSKTFFDPGRQVHLGARGRPRRQRLRRDRRQGRHLQDHARRQGHAFYKTNTTNVVSLAFAQDRRPDRRHRIARARLPHRRGRQGVRAARFAVQEIHALRSPATGRSTPPRCSGAPGGEDRPRRPIRPSPEPPRAAGADGLDRDHRDHRRRRPVGAAVDRAVDRGAPRRGTRGAIYRIRPDGLWDTLWDTGDDCAVRPAHRAGRQRCSSGTGTEGKIFRVGGDPARATLLARAPRAAGHGAPARAVRPHHRRHEQSRQAVRAVADARRDAAPTSPTCATPARSRPGASSAGARRRAPGRGRRSSRARGNTATPDETWSAWSKRLHRRRRRADRQPERALPAVARGAQRRRRRAGRRSLTSVTAAYLPRNLRPEVASITVHPPGTVFQRPFSTGELEIAGFEDNTSDGRSPSQPQPAPGGRRRPPRARARPPDLPEGAADVRLEGGGRQRRPAAVRRARTAAKGKRRGSRCKRGLWDPIFVWDTTSVPDGTYFVKVAASDAPSNSPATALVGELESVELRHRQHAAAHRGAAGRAQRARARRSRSSSATSSRAVQRVEYSLDASRWRVVYPKDGIPDSRREEFEVTLDEAEAGAQRHHPRDRRDEQRRDGGGGNRAADVVAGSSSR